MQNLLLHSENAAGWTSNPAYITVTSNVEVAPDSTVTMDTITDTAVNIGHYISQTTGTITPGVFCFSAYIKPIAGCSFSIVAGGTVSDGIGILVDGSTLQYISTHTTGTGFALLDYKIQAVPNGSYRVSITFSHPKTQLGLIIATNKAKTNTWGWAYVGTGDSIGVWGMQFVQANWACDYTKTTTSIINTSLPRNAVQKQNLALQSEDISNVAWTKSDTTATLDNTVLDSTGTISSTRLNDNSNNNVHYFFQSMSSTIAKTYANYTVSCEMKAGTKRYAALYIYNATTAVAYLDLVTGVVTSTVGSALNIRAECLPLPNGWFKCSLSVLLQTTMSAFGAMMINVANGGAYVGDGTGTIYVTKFQCVQANWAGDYQKTTSIVINNPIRNIAQSRNVAQKQNFLPYSEDMSKFTASSLNLGSKVKNPINGAVTADVLVPTVGSAQHYCYITIPSNPILTAGGVATYSALCKSYGWNWIRLQLAVAGGNVMAYFNIANGTVGTLVDGGQQIIAANIKPFNTPHDTGWYEVTFTVKPAQGKIFGEAYFLVTDTDNTNFFVGDGVKGIAVFASQLTGVNWRGDYQVTNGTQVTNPIRNLVSKQNLVAFSEDMSADTQTQMIPTYNSGLDIYGNMTADRITDNAVASFHGVTKSCSAAKNMGVYTFSAYVRPIAGCSFALIASDGTSGAGVVIDGATLALVGLTSTGSGATYINHSVVANPNGLYRVDVTVNFTIKAPTTISVLANKAKVTTWGWAYSGTGDSIEVWGWQVVQANWAGDYALTNGVPLTNPIRNII